MERYECDHCGACCRQLLVEAYWVDALREPRLLSADVSGWVKSLTVLEDEDRCLIIAGTKACTFLQENRCTIYPTRPNACVAMQAGDEGCQTARQMDGLPPLAPIEGPSGCEETNNGAVD